MKQYDDIEKMMRRHSVEPSVFVLSVDESGKPSGMAAGWNVKCSYHPPTIAVALSRSSYTRELIESSREFVIAVPAEDQAEVLEYFGSVSGRFEDKITTSKIATQPSTQLKTPLLSDARVNYECKLVNVVQTGDHHLCIGEIVAAHYNKDKDQLFFAGRDEAGKRVFNNVKTNFADDK